MADPLSIASGVAGLVALSSKVLAEGYHFIQVVEDCPRALRALLSETAAINSILDQIQNLVTESAFATGSQSPISRRALDSLLRLKALDDGRLLLKNVESALKRCEQINGERLNNMRKRVIWPFQEREVKELLNKLGSMREMFTAALSVDAAGALQRIEKQFDDIIQNDRDSKRQRFVLEETTNTIYDTQLRIQEQDKEQLRIQRIRKILNQISPGDAVSERHRDIRRQRSAGSGLWFFETDEWKMWLSDDRRFFWCRGNAGTGKTVLMSAVRDYLEDNQDPATTAVAHFYFDYKDTINQTVERVFSSILKQLADHQLRLQSKFERLFPPDSDTMGMSIDDIISVIVSISQEFEHVYLLFDALDEGDYNTQDYVISYLSHISKDCQSVRYLISSRPHLTQIRIHLQNPIEYELSANEGDIELLVRSRLGKNRDLSSDFIEDVLKKLSSSAGGMILFVVFQLQYILEQPNMKKKRDALATIPTDINKIYDKAIDKIRRQIETRRELALRALTWIKYALRPLKIKELQEAVAIEDGDKNIDSESLTEVDTVIDVCAGLVIVDHASGTIRFLHFTVEQYLRGRLDIFQRVHHPQFQLANICLIYLAFDWLSPELTNPLEPSSSLSTLIESNALLEYVVKYSHLHWNYYLSGAINQACPILPDKYEAIIGDSRRRRKIFQLFFIDSEQEISRPRSSCRLFGKSHAASVWGLDDLLRKYLVDDDTCLNALDDHGRTPLSFAIQYGWIEAVDLLLSFQEIDINVADDIGRTPTWWGAATRSEQCLRLLLDTPGIQPNSKDATGTPPLIRAAIAGANGCLRAFLDCPLVDANSSDINGATALHWACQTNKEETIKILLDHNDVYLDAVNSFGQTPLFAACGRGDEAIVKLLLERHANVNHQDIGGDTPLHMAVSGGDKNLAIVKLLLDIDGIETAVKDCSSETPLSQAKSSCYTQITKLLTEREERSASR